MAPPRRQTKPIKASNTQIVDFTTPDEDTIECELPEDPLSVPQSYTESYTESPPLITQPLTQPPTQPPIQPPIPSILDDQPDRIEWTPEMIHTLFLELLEQAQDGKRADSGFKKEAWDSVLREVQEVYIGPYLIPLYKVKQKEQTFKGYYKDWKFLRDQSGFGWDEETRMITASEQAWNDICAVRSPPRREKSRLDTNNKVYTA
jgi:hypothetical protein